MISPPALLAGDRIRVVAPSSPFDRTLVLRGLGWLAERYDVVFERGLFSRTGYLAGDDARRSRELNAALDDPDAKAVVAARGGYGATRIAHEASLRSLLDRPKWVVGFSDITALHLELFHVGVSSLHAHNVAGLGRGDAARRDRWLRALERPNETTRYERLEAWRGGTAAGRLVGGNLTVLFSCLAARRGRIGDGSVLLLEDVSEAPYRLDRMLSSLLLSGALDRVSAVVVGDFTDCGPGKHAVSAEQALRDRLGELGVPIVSGVPVGHGRRNDPIPIGYVAKVDATRGVVEITPD